MNCRKVQSYLSTYSEGLLSPEVLTELEVHIRDCKSCEREKHQLDEIRAAAHSLEAKSAPSDFNLKLLNRIYAEQSHPTESYLPTPAPSWFGRTAGMVSGLALIAVAVLIVFVSVRTPSELPGAASGPVFSQANGAGGVSAAAVRHLRHRVPANIYENIIGVSGQASNYRATGLSQEHVLRLADAKVESLYIESMRRLGADFIPASAWMRADNHSFDRYSPYVRMRTDAPLIRNASVSTTY